MNKNSINNKEIRNFIIENRANGKTDQDIYNELTAKYFDKKTIALLIMGTVTQELKEKYKVPNTLLLILVGITILIKISFVFGMSLDIGKTWPLLFVFLVPLINVYFFYEIIRYNAMMYKVIGLLTLASVFKVLGNAMDSGWTDTAISLILAGVIIGLSFYLSGKLMPNYNPKKLTKDSNGEYIIK